MAARKSPLYTALGIVFGLIVLAGGAAKFYRGLNGLMSSKSDPKVTALLTDSDAEVHLANDASASISPKFQALLSDFDRTGR